MGLDHTWFLYLLLKIQQRQRRKKSFDLFYGNCTLRAAVPAGLTLLSAEQLSQFMNEFSACITSFFLSHFISKAKDNANMTLLNEKSVRMASLYSTKKSQFNSYVCYNRLLPI